MGSRRKDVVVVAPNALPFSLERVERSSLNSRMRTTRPLPMTVPPATPWTWRRCGPRFFITTSNLPLISSTTSATRCPPVFTSSNGAFSSGSFTGSDKSCASMFKGYRSFRTTTAGRPASVERLKLSRRPIASTITVGMVNCCPLTRTIIALWMAKLVGNFIVNAVPWPGVDSTSRVPLRRDTLSRTTSRPTPRPLSSLSFSAVEKPGRKIRSITSLSLSI